MVGDGSHLKEAESHKWSDVTESDLKIPSQVITTVSPQTVSSQTASRPTPENKPSTIAVFAYYSLSDPSAQSDLVNISINPQTLTLR